MIRGFLLAIIINGLTLVGANFDCESSICTYPSPYCINNTTPLECIDGVWTIDSFIEIVSHVLNITGPAHFFNLSLENSTVHFYLNSQAFTVEHEFNSIYTNYTLHISDADYNEMHKNREGEKIFLRARSSNISFYDFSLDYPLSCHKLKMNSFGIISYAGDNSEKYQELVFKYHINSECYWWTLLVGVILFFLLLYSIISLLARCPSCHYLIGFGSTQKSRDLFPLEMFSSNSSETDQST